MINSKQKSSINFYFFCVVAVREGMSEANFLSSGSHDRIRLRSVHDLISGCSGMTSDLRPGDFERAGSPREV